MVHAPADASRSRWPILQFLRSALAHAPLRSALIALLWLLPPTIAAAQEPGGGFVQAMLSARRALESGHADQAREWIQRALERDPRSVEAWKLRAEWAVVAGDVDDRVYALHQALRNARAQRLDPAAVAALREQVLSVDGIAKDLLSLDTVFAKKLFDLAARYEKESRPHAAIEVLKTILALDPLDAAAQASIERIASRPDPSLAADAKPKDLFADVSREWIEQHDREHATWETRAKLERENYDTYTDAGYEVLVRAGEAMEQMNAFYRRFFRYGTEEDGKSVPRIALHIFKSRDEYLKLGKGPPVEWSGGHFTGDSVETYIDGGFDSMTGTLFHEAAHQFVSLATSAAGWLNEGLASFFEGTRILPNGTVLMNLPANHRLFPLAARMEKGWMSGPTDGIDPKGEGEPERAPTFRTVLENEYAWGPPWYAPTWGVVYFLYNYQDPVDGRFVYRRAFGDFVNASGGRQGEGAVENFEKVVLANPMPPIRGFARPEGSVDVATPKTVGDLDGVWKQWTLELRDEQQGKLERARPYLQWAQAAILADDLEAAQEHFEKGLVAAPTDPQLRLEFAALLATKLRNPDRAAKLASAAVGLLEAQVPPDGKAIAAAERALEKYDPKRQTLTQIEAEMASSARALVERYAAADRPSMVMDVSWRLGTDLGVGELFAHYERAARASGKSLRIWDLAYNERDLEGWAGGGAGSPFKPNGVFLDAAFGQFDPAVFDYQSLALDRTSSGDFSMEAEVQAERGKSNFAGFVFGRKDANSFHGLFFFPGKATTGEGLANSGYVDLLSSFGGGTIKTWRHLPVQSAKADGSSSAGTWHRLRVDVAGRFVDVWFDGELLATHEFQSIDVLRGSFGLMVGRGEARFRNVRYLASDPRDPAAAIERDLRLSKLREKGLLANGSFLGSVPPWPKLAKFVQGERSSWAEAGRVPQLVVFFSQQQNDLVRLDPWLSDLAQRHQRYGLRVLSIASPNDERSLAEYLKTHPLPDSVAVDYRAPRATGIGESFEAFFIRRFNLPRVLLLDLDQRVVWEGEPGLVAATPWKAGDGSFVDAPLEDLISRHKLDALPGFLEAWNSQAKPALLDGDLSRALECLRRSREFEAQYFPEVALAQSWLSSIEALTDGVENAAQRIGAQGRGPALAVVLEWRAALGGTVDGGLAKALKPVLEGKPSKDWAAIDRAATRYRNVLARKDADRAAAAAELQASVAKLEGAFPAELAAEIAEACRADAAARDAAIEACLAGARGRPARWLAREFLGFL